MKSPDINQYLNLRNALLAERARIGARLQEIAAALDQGGAAAPSPAGRRTFSAATKAKMALSQRARWAARRTGKPALAAVADVAPKKKRKMSAAGRARIIAATKARWARVRAAKAKTSPAGK